MMTRVPGGPTEAPDLDDEEPGLVSLVDLLTWIGEAKRSIALFSGVVALIALGVALLLPPIYTAKLTLLPPGAQQQTGSAAALATLGGLGLGGGLGGKTPEELYVSILKGDSVIRALDERFKLRERYEVENFESLRKVFAERVRVNAEKKSSVIAVEVDDKEPKFAADLANAHLASANQVLARLAVSEAQNRRVFFEQQLQEVKEALIEAEQKMRQVQERSGVIMLDRQAEALISSAAQLRAQIAEREVQLKVLRTSATAANPDVIRLNSELAAMRSELGRLESRTGGRQGSSVDLPVGRLPEAAIDYVRARRELRVQETLLESMIRQLEAAKLDEAKEGSSLQAIDTALPPEYKSKPSRASIVLGSTLLALLVSIVWVILKRYNRLVREVDPESDASFHSLAQAWKLRRA